MDWLPNWFASFSVGAEAGLSDSLNTCCSKVTPLSRYAVFGLIDRRFQKQVRVWQRHLSALSGNNLSLRFPVHITLRGRFLAEKEKVVEAFHQMNTSCSFPDLKDVALERPSFHKPGLAWLKVHP